MYFRPPAQYAGMDIVHKSGATNARVSFDTSALHDPWAVDAFQQALLRFRPSDHELHVDNYVSELIAYVRKSARNCFGPPATRARQPWISGQTLDIVRYAAGIRKYWRRVFQLQRNALGWIALRAWYILRMQRPPRPRRNKARCCTRCFLHGVA